MAITPSMQAIEKTEKTEKTEVRQGVILNQSVSVRWR